MSDLKEYIEKAVDGPLSRSDAEAAFNVIMGGDATPSQIGGFPPEKSVTFTLTPLN